MFNFLNQKHLNYTDKAILRAHVQRDVLNIKAIKSDETENFRVPVEPTADDTVTIYLRCGKDNVEEALLCFNAIEVVMEKCAARGLFDYYRAELPPTAETVYYYFEIKKNNTSYFYMKEGLLSNMENGTRFEVIRGFKTPDWAKGAVMYQIFVDRFCNGDSKNDVVNNEYIYLGKPVNAIKDWNQLPAADDIRNFYGGDLQGVMQKLDYLMDLGVEVIYFNPLFVSPSNHKYDIQDYDYIDPHIAEIPEDGGSELVFEKFNNNHASKYGIRTTNIKNLEASNAYFCHLTAEAHKRGIKVILDGVFNHCGAFHKWLDKEGFYKASGQYPAGAMESYDSIYHNFFRWTQDGRYDGWWGLDNHPKLHYEASENLCQYMMEIGKKWVSPPFSADGWRLDVAADLGLSPEFNHAFWRRFRNAVKSANPEAIILAEHYGDASSWLQGDQWDTIMNYDAFMEPISWFLTGMEKHSDGFREDLRNNAGYFMDTMRFQMAKFSIQSLQTSMNQLSNHDHSRFLTRTNHRVGRTQTVGAFAADEGINKGIMKEAIVMQMTWPGSPTLYYGDEAGVTGWTDPDNRRTYPWGKEDMDLLGAYKIAIAIHKSYSAIRTGSLEFLYGEYGVISYARFDKNSRIVVVINNTDMDKRLNVPVWQADIALGSKLTTLLVTTLDGFTAKPESYIVESGKLSITMKAFSSAVLLAE